MLILNIKKNLDALISFNIDGFSKKNIFFFKFYILIKLIFIYILIIPIRIMIILINLFSTVNFKFRYSIKKTPTAVT